MLRRVRKDLWKSDSSGGVLSTASGVTVTVLRPGFVCGDVGSASGLTCQVIVQDIGGIQVDDVLYKWTYSSDTIDTDVTFTVTAISSSYITMQASAEGQSWDEQDTFVLTNSETGHRVSWYKDATAQLASSTAQITISTEGQLNFWTYEQRVDLKIEGTEIDTAYEIHIPSVAVSESIEFETLTSVTSDILSASYGSYALKYTGADDVGFIQNGAEIAPLDGDRMLLRFTNASPGSLLHASSTATGSLWLYGEDDIQVDTGEVYTFVYGSPDGGGTSRWIQVGGGPISSDGAWRLSVDLDMNGQDIDDVGKIVMDNGTQIIEGQATPEDQITAPVGSIYSDTGGSTGTTLYVKEDGSGDTGWAAMASTDGFTMAGDIAMGSNDITGAGNIGPDLATSETVASAATIAIAANTSLVVLSGTTNLQVIGTATAGRRITLIPNNASGLTLEHAASSDTGTFWFPGTDDIALRQWEAIQLECVSDGTYLRWMQTGATPWNGHDELSDSAWDDLIITQGSWSTPAASRPTQVAFQTDMELYSFAQAEYIRFEGVQIPHSYKPGTDLKFHVHFVPDTDISAADTITWTLDYTVASIYDKFTASASVNTVFTNDSGTRAAIDAIDNTITGASSEILTSAVPHLITASVTISGTDLTGSAILAGKLTFASATGDFDTNSGECLYLDADFHYEKNRLGSENELSG